MYHLNLFITYTYQEFHTTFYDISDIPYRMYKRYKNTDSYFNLNFDPDFVYCDIDYHVFGGIITVNLYYEHTTEYYEPIGTVDVCNRELSYYFGKNCGKFLSEYDISDGDISITITDNTSDKVVYVEVPFDADDFQL